MSCFIAIEGIDAAGKATQSQLLVDYLKTRGLSDARVKSFPNYTTTVGRIVREMLYGRIKMTAFGREDTLTDSVKAYAFQSMLACDRIASAPALRRAILGGLVADRYCLSGYVYGTEEGCEEEWLRSVLFTAVPAPDLWLFLDVPIDAVEQRLRVRAERDGRPLDLNERNLTKLARVRQRYLSAFGGADTPIRHLPDERRVVINATGTVDEVHTRIVHAVERVFGETGIPASNPAASTR